MKNKMWHSRFYEKARSDGHKYLPKGGATHTKADVAALIDGALKSVVSKFFMGARRMFQKQNCSDDEQAELARTSR